MLRDPLLMLVSMDQDLRDLGPLRVLSVLSILRMSDGVPSQPEQLRHRKCGQEEKRDNESLPHRHAGILPQPLFSGQTVRSEAVPADTLSACRVDSPG